MSPILKSAAVRAIRTFIQAFLGVFLAGIAGATTLGALTQRNLLEVAAVAGIVAVLSLAQNVLEQTTKAPIPRG